MQSPAKKLFMQASVLKVLLLLRPYIRCAGYRLLKKHFFGSLWNAELSAVRKDLDASHPTIANSERAVLIEQLVEAYPFTSLLELGCAFGKNFHILAPLFPDVAMHGIDADAEIIPGANAYLQERGLKNATLTHGRMEDLSHIPDKSYDVVYTCASLLYVPANSIEHVISEMLRIAKKRVLILEQHVENKYYKDQARGVFVQGQGSQQGFWLRDYMKLLSQFVERERIVLTKIPNPIWPTEQWKQHACLIEVFK